MVSTEGFRVTQKAIKAMRKVPATALKRMGLLAPPPTQPDEEFDRLELLRIIIKALKTLTPREEKVIKKRFFQAKSREEVGEELGVIKERVRQIEMKALRKLRHPSRSRKLKDFIRT